jgi:hypothetical protein
LRGALGRTSPVETFSQRIADRGEAGVFFFDDPLWLAGIVRIALVATGRGLGTALRATVSALGPCVQKALARR